MAIKHFLATCEKKVSKHPVKDGKTLTVPTLATTQANAKSQVRAVVEKRDLELASSEFTYNDWYKTPQLEPITEEEYNAELLAFEGESTIDYPVLNDAGYYDDRHEDAEISQFIFTNNGQEFDAAKVFILKVADNQWSYGFKFASSHAAKYEPMTQDRFEYSRDEAIDKGIGRLERFLDYHDEYGPEEDKSFISALLEHDFYAGFSIEEKTEEQLEITLSEETKASQKRLEEAFNKPAANDSVFKPTVKKAVMNITDDIHAVISTINLNDEGYAYGFEVNSKTERLAGNVDSISEERFVTEREAVKHAGQAISDCLATYDTSLTLYKAFAQSKYIDYFEENSMVMGEQEDPIKTAIRKRFEARPTAQTNESEVTHTYETISHLVTEHTNIEALIKAIETTQKCNEMYMSPQVEQLVARCTPTPSKLNTTIYKAVQQRLKKAGIADENKVMTAHDYIAPNITDKTDIDKLCDTIAKLKNPHNLLVPANACLLPMQCEKKEATQSNSSQIPWDVDDKYQIFISNCLVTNDAHLSYSSKEYAEMGKRLAQVINEFSSDESFDKKATLNNIENNEWASGEECAVSFMNVRLLRALFRENAETSQSKDTTEQKKEKHDSELTDVVEIVSLKEMPNPHSFTENTSTTIETWPCLKVLTKDIGDDLKAHMSIGISQVQSGLYHHEFIGIIENQNGVFYAIQKSLAKPNVNNQLTNAVHGAISEIEKILNAKFSNLKDAIHTIKQWRENKVGAEWFTQHSHTFDVTKSLPEPSINEPNNPLSEQDEQKPLPTEPKEQATQDHRQDVNEHSTDSSNSDPVVSNNIVDKEPANEPLVEVTTIADLPEDYQKNPNLKLWMQGFKTDLQHVKPDQNGRLSIKTQYRLMKATEIWGPIGVGWGYNVLREWIDTGAPIIMNGEISQFFEQIHKVEIEFWYRHEGEKVSFTQYGDTRKLYLARGGYFVHDDEVEKKSLSDALGKAMSMTGICADVYLGTYDGDTLINKTEQIQLANRQLKQLEFDAQTSELAINKAKSYTDKFSTAPSMAEIKRLEKLAITALEAYPTPDEDSKRKKSKAIGAIAIQAQNAIDDFNKDLHTTQQEQANG